METTPTERAATSDESPTNLARLFALVMGLVFVLIAFLGFTRYGTTEMPPSNAAAHAGVPHAMLLGLFPVNDFHNAVHLIFGLGGLLAYYVGMRTSIAYARILGVAYLLLAIAGMVPGLQSLWGLCPLWGNDVWLHGLIAVAGLAVGFLVPHGTTDDLATPFDDDTIKPSA